MHINVILLRNWVLFNITSPLYGVLYKRLRYWLHNHHTDYNVELPNHWSHRVTFTKGFTLYRDDRNDHEYIQWLFIRISWDAADVYHLYVVPAFKAMHRLKWWWGGAIGDDIYWVRKRARYAWRHSYGSGHGIGLFIDHYINHPWV